MPIGNNLGAGPSTVHDVQYATLAALRAAGVPSPSNPSKQFYRAVILGYDYAGDGGGGAFIWRTADPGGVSFTDDNSGLVIIPDNAPNDYGAWLADIGENVCVQQLGLTENALINFGSGTINARFIAACAAIFNLQTNSAYQFSVVQRSLAGGTDNIISPSLSALGTITLPDMDAPILGRYFLIETSGLYTELALCGTRYNGVQFAGIYKNDSGVLVPAPSVVINPIASQQAGYKINFRNCNLSSGLQVMSEDNTGHPVQSPYVIELDHCDIGIYGGNGAWVQAQPYVNGTVPDLIIRNSTFSITGVGAQGAINGFRRVILENCTINNAAPNANAFFVGITESVVIDAATLAQFGTQAVGVVPYLSPSVSDFAPVSGTIYQNTSNLPLHISVPCTLNPTSAAAASVIAAVGPVSPPAVTVAECSQPAAGTVGSIQTLSCAVPPGMYYSFTAVNAVINQGAVAI